MRQRAIIGALLLMGVGVALGATVFRTDIAQATGLAQDVTINNTSANPVPVRQQGTVDVNVTNTVPIHEQGTAAVRSADDEVGVARIFQSNSSAICEGTLYTVPSGKQLVVEYVSGSAFATGSPLRADGAVGTIVPRHLLWMPYQRVDSNNWVASEAVHFVFPAGSELHASVEMNGGTTCSFDVTLGGYLQPSP